jgi:hypothetical protein
MIEIGSKVFLRGSHAGEPGTVIRQYHGKLTLYWKDLDYSSRHHPESLEEATVDEQSALADRKEAGR